MRVTDEQLIAALTKYGTKTAAAKALGITPITVSKRIKKPSFQEKYKAVLDDILSESVDCMKLALKDAVKVLVDTMHDEDAPKQTKVAAADCMMRHVQRFVELQEFTQRIEALERERDG